MSDDVSEDIWMAVTAVYRAQLNLDSILTEDETKDLRALQRRESLRKDLKRLEESLRSAKTEAQVLESWGTPD